MIERKKVQDILGEQKGGDVSIDVHTHNGFDHMNTIRRRYPTSQSIKDLELKLRLASIDYAVSFPCPSSFYYFDFRDFSEKDRKLTPLPAEAVPFEHANRQMIYEVSLFGNGRIFPFASILPQHNELRQVESLEQYAKKGYLFGLKLHTLPTRTKPSELTDSPFIELATIYSLPIMIHSGPDEFSRPENIIALARHHQSVRFCIAHAGRFEKNAYDMLLREGDTNVFLDTSPFLSLCALTPLDMQRGKGGIKLDLPYDDPGNALTQLYSLMPNNLVWGTDEPWTTIMDDTQQTILTKFDYFDEANLLKSLPSDIRVKIANDNTQRFLFGNQ